MKVILLNLPWINTKDHYGVKSGARWASKRSRKQNLEYYPFPFYMAYAASLLKKNGVDAKLRDAIADKKTKP
ncbi:hypothetical protein GF327_05250, partial [Candidatus Woesearchaeota archaeon]|nr:hypothetical protein [Candidatus Woesearchaeota archaeon]